MPSLFSPLTLRGMTLRNRIAMSPMCMYTAGADGLATDWHLAHLGAHAIGGVGMIITEATAVEARGRISVNDLGLWEDAQIEPLARIVRLCRSQGVVMCTQLAHAGRKAWSPNKGVGPFPAVAPSALAHDTGWVEPKELDSNGIASVVAAFRSAAVRAVAAGFDAVEIHSAHGYLLHQFLSPLSNYRRDMYGGSLENRARLLLEVVASVREVLPASHVLIVRLSCTDWAEGGLVVEDQVQVACWLKQCGVDLVDCSSAGVAPAASIPLAPGYQIPFAASLRRGAGIATMAVGLITSPELAEETIANGRADVVALGRVLLRDPNWPLHAARALRADITWPQQYRRARLD